MQSFLILLVVVLFSVCSAEKVKYNGYSVLRMQINDTNLEDIKSIVERFHLDVWSSSAVEKRMDIMIPPNEDISKILKTHQHIIHIQDVEDWIQMNNFVSKNVSQKRQPFFDYFPTYAEVVAWLDVVQDLYPENTETFYIGETYFGTPIRGIKLFNSGSNKRAVFMNAGIHAREWITITSSLYIIQQILSQRTLLDHFDFYIVPVFNIDGYDYTHTTDRLWRKNREPNVGSDCVGTDLNRNFAFQWGREGSSGDPCSLTFRGYTPESSPETKGFTTFIQSLRNVAYYLDIHCCGAMFMSPWGFTSEYPVDYGEMYRVMQAAQTGIRSINGNTYAIGTSNRVIYITSGATVDWLYGQIGVVPSFTIEVIGQFVAPPENILPLAREVWSGVSASVTALIPSIN